MSSRAVVVQAEAADEIQAALDARESLEQSFGARQVVDQGETLRRVAADVEADRRTLPPHRAGFAALADQRALAIAQSDADRAGAFLALDVGVRLAVLVERLLQHVGQSLGALAEQLLRRRDDLAAREGVLVALARRGALRRARRIAGDGQRDQCDAFQDACVGAFAFLQFVHHMLRNCAATSMRARCGRRRVASQAAGHPATPRARTAPAPAPSGNGCARHARSGRRVGACCVT